MPRSTQLKGVNNTAKWNPPLRERDAAMKIRGRQGSFAGDGRNSRVG